MASSFEERLRERIRVKYPNFPPQNNWGEVVNATPSKDKPLMIMGHGIPLNAASQMQWPHTKRYNNAIENWRATPLTVRERAMIQFMAEITDKPGWPRKIKDHTILNKWREELRQRGEGLDYEVFSTGMFDYCLSELEQYVVQLETAGFFPAVDATASVYKSDSLIDNQLKEELRLAVAPLENVPAHQRDWHPDSNEKVLDLVHPSLFPLLYGRSRILSDRKVTLVDCVQYTGMGDVIAIPDPMELPRQVQERSYHNIHPDVVYSTNFQWLPCDFTRRGDGQVSITSYINNLHPVEHKPLYTAIEKILGKAMPMLDATILSTDTFQRLARILVRKPYYTNQHTTPPAWGPDEGDEDDEYEFREAWDRENRILIQPEPPERYAPRPRHDYESEGFKVPSDFDNLQVIVKLANIHLAPEKPSYSGGSWHIEGSLNEHICATVLYYYDCENITDSHLSFREHIGYEPLEQDVGYEQSDYEHLEMLFGIGQDEPQIQSLAKVLTREDRLLVFPNVLQHCVSSFKLADPSRPGHRKILALFLVDPHTPIPSTANVPPQQKEWWSNMVHKIGPVADLPPELAEQIVDNADDFPIGLEEAKEIRLKLMEERKAFSDDVDAKLNDEKFSFCEH